MLNDWFNPDFLKRLFVLNLPKPAPPVAPGIYHVIRQRDGVQTRFHLRVEHDGGGMLIANATAAARLSPTGTLIAKRLFDGSNEAAIVQELEANFSGASQKTMHADIDRLRTLLNNLADPNSEYPVINFEDAALSPRQARLIAPFQADVHLAEPERLLPIIKRLWEVAIPHVTIHAPAQPDTGALVRAIEYAEDLGMIAGVRGRGSDLHHANLLRDLALAGIDHVTMPYASDQADLHDQLYGTGDHAATTQAIAPLHEYEVCPVAEVPLVELTVDGLRGTLDTLLALDVTNVSFFAVALPDARSTDERDGALSASTLLQIATLIEETASEVAVRYVWQPSVLRNTRSTLAAQVQQGPRCSSEVAIRVELDGSVLPPRGAHHSAGNLLRDPWEKIWQNPAFRTYRERVEAPTRCAICPGLALCAADCPADPAGWAYEK